MHLQVRKQHCTMPQYPKEVLNHIFSFVAADEPGPAARWLGHCSRVCRAWRAAALAARSNLHVQTTRRWDHTHRSFTVWLQANGHCVTNLMFCGTVPDHRHAVVLPLQQLRRLRSCTLERCRVQECLAGSSSSSNTGSWQQEQQLQPGRGRKRSSSMGNLSSLTALTQLHIDDASWAGFSNGLLAVSGLTALRDLLIGGIQVFSQKQVAAAEKHMQECLEQSQLQRRLWLYEHDERNQELSAHWQQHGLPTALREPVLQQQLHLNSLTQLTRLSVDTQLFPAGVGAPLSCLVQLQQLKLSRWSGVKEPGVLARLPASITSLTLRWLGTHALDSTLVPSLRQLPALKCLQLSSTESLIMPDFLSSMQQLQDLKLAGLHKHALQPLLQGLRCLSCLHSLQLEADSVQALPASQVAQYSALLPASEQLSQVTLDCLDGCMLAPGSLQHVFAAHRRLPGLTQLQIGHVGPQRRVGRSGITYMPLGADDAGLLVACCPSLQQLCLAGCVQQGAELSPLQDLTDLKRLTVGGPGVDDSTAKTVLAQLEGLRSLHLYQARGVSDIGFGCLTALGNLTCLGATGCGLKMGSSSADRCFSLSRSRANQSLYLRTKPGQTVHQQLLELCRSSMACWREMAQQLLAQLQEKQEETNQLKFQLDASSCEAARAHAEAAEAQQAAATSRTVTAGLQREIMRMQEELAAAMQQLAEGKA